MKVFLSWSGTRSRAVAEAFRDWLPKLINAVEPWISVDIEKGKRWGPEISDQLETTAVGITCLDRDNLHADWILFEAGAVSKTKNAHVCTFLLGVRPVDIEEPLAQFHHTQFEKEDIRKLVHTINGAARAAKEKTQPDKSLDEMFDLLWPTLEEKLRRIVTETRTPGPPARDAREILEDILQIVRRLQAALTPSKLGGGLERLFAEAGIEATGAFRRLRPGEGRLSDIVEDAIRAAARRPELLPKIIDILIERELKRTPEPGPETETEEK